MGTLINRTHYENPNVNVDTMPAGGAGGGLDIDPFFMNMAKRKMRLQSQRLAMENEQMKRDMRDRAARPDFSDRNSTQLERAQEADAIDELTYKKKLRDIDLNPPKKLITGFNINPGLIEDTSMLPVSMRPKNAGFAGAEENTAHIDPKSHGTGGFDPVAAEEAARAGGHGTGGAFEATGLLDAREQANRDREAKRQAQLRMFLPGQYGSGRG